MSMDVDCDMDQDLMAKFSSLGTTDHDVLISELQRLLDFQLNQAGCAFFLDMANWNLQAAVGAFYDFASNGITDKLPSMSFVQDVTIGEGESVPPNTQFVKTWRIQNTGSDKWPNGVFLKFTGGDQLGPVNSVTVSPLEAGESIDVSINMIAPSTPGMYQGQWRMCTPTGSSYFGDVIWVILSVDVGGLLGVTQQLSHLGQEFGSPSHPSTVASANPFSPNTPIGRSTQLSYSVPQNSPSSLQGSPVKRSLFETCSTMNEQNGSVILPNTTLCGKEDEGLATQLEQTSIAQQQTNQWDCQQTSIAQQETNQWDCQQTSIAQQQTNQWDCQQS